jgi:hypothetical protein
MPSYQYLDGHIDLHSDLKINRIAFDYKTHISPSEVMCRRHLTKGALKNKFTFF